MDGWQTFLRMANLYNPNQMGGDMPSELPVGSIPTMQRDYSSNIPQMPMMDAPEPEQPMSTLEAFRNNVLNPPQRKHMTYPKNTLAGLQAGLQIAATPTDYEKNRVYVNGDPYQQVRAFKDPTTGEIKYINKYKQPGFMEQVMKAMPAAVSPGVDILNQPYQDEIADWELKNKGLAAAANAESAMALAKQREAQAGYTGQRAGLEQQKIDISRLTAEERVRLSQLNTLTDAEKLQMLQDGRMSLAEFQAAEAMKRVETQQAGATQRTNIQQSGANQRSAAGNAAAMERVHAAGEEARKTKATPSPASSVTQQLPTQQKVALQNRAQEVVNQNPEWAEYVSFNEQGFPVISMPDTKWGPGQSPEDIQTYNRIYEAIYGTARPSAAPITPPTKPPATKPAPKPAPKQQVATPPPTQEGVKPIIQHSASTGQYRISYDGGKTWRPYNPTGKK